MVASIIRSTNLNSRQAYRRLLSLPAWIRWGVGIAAPLVVIGSALVVGAEPRSLATILVSVLLMAVVVTDLCWRRIFNWVTGPILAWVLGLAAFVGQSTFADALIGAAVCFGAMLVLHLLFGGGEGDVKLFAVIGAALGARDGFDVLMLGYLLAAMFAMLIVVVRGQRRVADLALSRPVVTSPLMGGHLPMAPFFGVAMALISVS